MMKRLSERYVFMAPEPAVSGDGNAPEVSKPVDEGVDSDQWGDIVDEEIPGDAGNESTDLLPEVPPITEEEVPPVEPVPKVPPVEPVPEPVPEPKPVEEPKPEPVEEPKPEPEPPVEEPVPEPQVMSEEERTALHKKARDSLTAIYKFDEETALKYETAPEEVIPRLAADLHMRIYNDVVNAVVGTIPQLVQQQLGATQQRKSDNDVFYEKWPGLKTHDTNVQKFAQLWWGMNPGATFETAVDEIGKHMSIALGIPVGEPTPTPAPVVPAATPHVPAGQVSVTEPPKPAAKSNNEWTAFSEDIDEE